MNSYLICSQEPPQSGFHLSRVSSEINIAGVLSSHRQCSVGICLRDAKGETLLAYCFKGRLARGTAEGQPMALIKGLELAKEYGVRQVSVEGWTEAQFQNLLSSSPSLLMDNGRLLEEAHSLCNLFYTHGMA